MIFTKIRLIGLKQVSKKGRPTQSESVSCNLQSGAGEAAKVSGAPTRHLSTAWPLHLSVLRLLSCFTLAMMSLNNQELHTYPVTHCTPKFNQRWETNFLCINELVQCTKNR